MTRKTGSMPTQTLANDDHARSMIAASDLSSAVVYQVYLRSFRDGNGDGIGDLPGLTDSLSEIAVMGCEAIWLNPCYSSPQSDHGYDISDYRSIEPAYGTLDDFDAMVAEAHRLGLRVLMDMVANHCSSQHVWFQEALASTPGSAARERFLFRDGRGADGELEPGNWQSVFGGPAWTRITEPEGTPGQWYLHSFDAQQPDLNWRNAEVRRDFEDVLRFWFDRGVDGFRIDVAHGHIKAIDLPDHPGAEDGTGGHNYAMWDQPEVHEIYRAWRAVADSYDEPKYFVGEIWVPTAESLANYLRPDELHQAFSFDLLVQPWNASRLRLAVESGLRIAKGSPAWTLANHDVHRAVTRYGQEQALEAPLPTDMIAAARRTGEVDVELGTRRARAASALLLALPGSVYLYQGEELGLLEALDLPDHARQDPIWVRSDGAELGRDGCRVPLPWSAEGANLGFSVGETASTPWLPQPDWFASYVRDIQVDDADSMLNLYRRLLENRRALFAPDAPVEWLDAGSDAIAFRRGDATCVVNVSDRALAVPADWGIGALVLATDASTEPDRLAPDSAAWFRISAH
ncbi:alpha-glucosidase [Microbacterium sp. W4I4]|uniref:glycoside hydrolase family 13 protein n=1 Tax=Microbacterium sp. W4I4 TaxID=3042295 RepID=UPI00278568C3|nr:glycoside hydrolase family 13 protein [Microbacterium sp. W4I4]MDQ0614689.1 alpha-glucosidase [Microbacterium sp. W4I4]